MNKNNVKIPEEQAEVQANPVAGIWACDRCGRRIQVIMEGTLPKKQGFTCVCGAEMRPGEEHVTPEATVAEEMAAVDKAST